MPSVGIAGLTLGGGLGILGRTYGVTSDRLVAARIVTADGRVVESDAHHEEDLFWALRGGGTGHFGVVTELVFRPVPALTATSFHLTWPFAQAGSLALAWMDWAPEAPDELAASLLVSAGADPAEDPVVELVGTMSGPAADARAQLDDLMSRLEVDPNTEELVERPYVDTMRGTRRRAARRGSRRAGHANRPPEQVRVLRAVAPAGGDRSPARSLRARPDRRSDERAGPLPVGRRLQPGGGRCHRLRPSRPAASGSNTRPTSTPRPRPASGRRPMAVSRGPGRACARGGRGADGVFRFRQSLPVR